MSPLSQVLGPVLSCLALAAGGPGAPGTGSARPPASGTPARADLYGDPLPPGALARLGTAQLRHEGADIAFSADGKTLFSADPHATVCSWDVTTGRLTRQTRARLPKVPRSQAAAVGAGLSPGGRLLAVFAGEGVYLYDTATGHERRRLAADRFGHESLTFSRDSRTLATLIGIADRYVIRLWNLSTGESRLTLVRPNFVEAIAFSPDGKLLASWEGGQVLHLWDAATGREVCQGRAAGRAWAFSPDGKTLATADSEGTVALWQTAGLKKQATFKPSAAVRGRTILTPRLAFAPDGGLLAVGGLETLVLWDVTTRKERLRLPDREARRLAFAPDGKTLACAGHSEIRLWDAVTGKRLHNRPGHDSHVWAVAVSPDGKVVASASWSDPAVRLWDAATGRPLAPSLQGASWVRSCAFAADGRLLVAGADVLQLLEAATGKELRRFVLTDLAGGRPRYAEVLAAHLGRDGKRLAAMSTGEVPGERARHSQITVWDAGTGAVLVRRPFRGNLGSCFTPDGDGVTVDGPDRLTVEDTATGQDRAVLAGGLLPRRPAAGCGDAGDATGRLAAEGGPPGGGGDGAGHLRRRGRD
jgi:WD40 repeat protein